MLKYGLVALMGLVICGCGSEKPTAESTATSPAAATAQANAAPDANSPVAVVSEFLDRVRRGGAAQVEAARLLTTRAQAECQRTGLKMGSMGSPAARFEVTRAEAVPEAEGSALVHSLWIEKNPEGEDATYQVVWAMQNEAEGWRISGLVMELEPGTDPVVIDFEDGDQAASMLGLTQDAPAAEQAAVPSENPVR
ncbi:hypothetical protein FF011L_44080 [Roseimaritima multifibrata]|uniref:Uncharacterized protein n=1 Tax=Roseimaritima multifibrata TaxID=1930274 RepID=A0A517ML86_9BACT|nr:hypothetical protein [Roseimaritima multifibrata]QDS95610.1 hypothetical protein FF011L_44080 [Roseimaritima multifibrata]